MNRNGVVAAAAAVSACRCGAPQVVLADLLRHEARGLRREWLCRRRLLTGRTRNYLATYGTGSSWQSDDGLSDCTVARH
jgi:hypothetical protein